MIKLRSIAFIALNKHTRITITPLMCGQQHQHTDKLFRRT
ncbi:hypothetical protein SALWKB12_1039 [Snodgrassella communis]|uniref:Uncharacterized protein n=1 Tax=Snodgrassella communis TaxID=2946699 RepID=A0A836Z6B7_9NEIS|nr:hypothetical protein SALWKB12_1039 [Snodgrassella communis]KDN15490.1 hypothetical protein SALWKB29_0594 [Snodgrassella communis]